MSVRLLALMLTSATFVGAGIPMVFLSAPTWVLLLAACIALLQLVILSLGWMFRRDEMTEAGIRW